ncbi:MAG: helix-turn-helix transcriptional regulator [Actinomycetota bacterium]
MSGHKPFKVLRDRAVADPKRRNRIERYRRQMLAAIALGELRESKAVTQRELAEKIGVTQANVSRIEHEDDVHISTLQSYIEALGGKLQIRAVFPDEVVDVHLESDAG